MAKQQGKLPSLEDLGIQSSNKLPSLDELGIKKKTLSRGVESTSPSLPTGGITNLNSLPSGGKQPIDAEIPSVLTPQGRKPYIQEQIVKKNKALDLSNKLNEYKATYDAVKGEGASESVNTPKPIPTISETESEIDRFKGGIKNSIENIVTSLKGVPARLSLASSDLTKRVFDKEIVDYLYSLPRITFDENGVDIKTGLTIDEVQQQSLNKLNELSDEVKATETITGNIGFQNPLRLAGGIVDAVSSLASTAIPSLASGGSLLLSEMVGQSVYDFNKAKAEKSGTTINKLYEDGKAEFKVPAVIGGISFGLEHIGLKGIEDAISNKLKGSGLKKAMILANDFNKEGATEWIQTGLDTANVIIANGGSIEDATKGATDAMFSQQGLEAYAKGFVGAGVASAGGRIAKSILPSTKSEITKLEQTKQEAWKDLANPELPLSAKETITNVIADTNKKIDAVQEKEDKSLENLNEKGVAKVEELTNKIEEIDASIESVSEAVKPALEKEKEKANEEIDNIIKNEERGYEQYYKTKEQIQEQESAPIEEVVTETVESTTQPTTTVNDEVVVEPVAEQSTEPTETVNTESQQEVEQPISKIQTEAPITNPKAGGSDKLSENREAEAVKPIKEGDKINLPPNLEGGQERNFEFKDGEWKQKIGNDYTEISKKQQEELNTKFNEQGQIKRATENIVLYHGSPHEFTDFKSNKIGSGEGNQAFGYGLYFTNEKNIAKHYAEGLSTKKKFWDYLMDGNNIELSTDEYNLIDKELDNLGYDGDLAQNSGLDTIIVDGKEMRGDATYEALRDLFSKDFEKNGRLDNDLTDEQFNKLLDIKKRISNPQLYEIEVSNEKSFMSWDESVSKEQASKLGYGDNITGKQIYNDIKSRLGSQRKTSEFLASKGIDGIIYKSDKGTGGKSGLGRNYVIFNEGDIAVKKINDKAVNNEQGTTIKETKETAQPIEKPTTKEQVGNAENTKVVDPVSKLQTAKEKLAEKRKALKDLDINLSVSADPKQKAKALYEYHSALVDVAKEYINQGIKTVEDFAKEIGEKVSKTVKDAWEEANGGNKLKESDFEQQVKPKEPKSSDEFTKLTHKSLQNEEIRNTLSNVERETGTELSDEQKEYQRTKLIEALHSGEDMIDASKEEFGDEYVSKTLAFLKDNRNTLPAENEALLYVSLENDLQRQLEYDPENVTIKKQLDLVRNESLKRFRSFAIATGFGRLRQIARFGFDVDAYANSLLTSTERGDRKKVSKAVEATPDEINQMAEERESFTIAEPTVKRNKKVVRQEIDEVLRQLRKDLIKSARGASGLMSSLPLADQIKAVTPHVIKLSKLLAELGGMKAKEIISEIRKSIEDVAPDIKDSDIKDILTAKPTAKDNLERMKDNAKARIETLKQQIEDKKRELKITNKTKPDAELKSLLEQEKELKKIANEYLTPESLKRIDESKQKAIISKLENDIKELDKQIMDGQKKPMTERTAVENDKIAELKGIKKAKQAVLEDLDPNPKEFTKQALIDAGYGRKIKVDGEEREILDWKLLAGEEGSIDNIREKVEQSLEKSGFTQAKISRMKDAFESEYNRLRADVIEKSLNELNRRNTPNEPVKSRSYSERLAELYNLGLFENQSDGYDYLINKAVGLSDASQESFFGAKELAKSLSELYKSTDINGKKMTEMQLKEAVRNVNDEFTKLMNSISWKDSNIAFKVMTVLQETMGLGQRFILGTAKQAIENPLSGYVERAYQKAGSIFDGYNPKELRKHNREMARVLFKDNSLNASLPYGEITTPFITRTRTEEWVNGLSDSQAYHAMMTTFMGRSFLESADSMHKIALTEKYFQNNVIKLLTNKTYKGRMTKQEALRFVTEKLTGQKFEEAQKSAEKIINDINESAGKKILPNNREAILRFANDITKLSLLEGTNLTEKELTASFKSAYRVAGLGLGHEANNFLSNMLSTQNERIERKLKKAVQEKQWWKASAYTGASILSKNILNPFVGGGTNWVVLTAEKAGLNPFNMVYNAMQAKESNLDLSTEQGLREVERVMFDQLRFKTSASRYFTGAMASLITYGAIKAFQGTDDGEDKLKKLSEWLNHKENKWVAKYFNVMSPSMLIAYMYMLDDNLGGYFKNLFNVRTDTYSDANQLLDAGQTMLSSNRKVEKDKAWGQLGAVIGGKLQAPAPWRLTRDGLQVIQAIKGKPVYQADYTKPNTFASGFFMGGMLDFLGWKPQNDISEDFRELKIHNSETGKYDIYELTDKQKSEFIKYRNDFAKSPQFKLLQKEYEDYKKSNKDVKMDVEKELNKILNTYAKSMFLDEKTTFDKEGNITNIKKVK